MGSNVKSGIASAADAQGKGAVRASIEVQLLGLILYNGMIGKFL